MEPFTIAMVHNTTVAFNDMFMYVGGTRPESPSDTTASTTNMSTSEATSSQSLATFLRSAVTSIVAAVKEALRHLIACIPDDLDLEHRYDQLCM
jgi:hypothetical protein